MVFIIGGAGSGQAEYAAEHFPGAELIRDYHRIVENELKLGENPMEKAEELILGRKSSEAAAGAETVITSDELGGGVVPADAFDREWRECSGRINCLFAKESRLVVRMICGVPQVLKGQETEQRT